jgi:hypothetical protein
MYGNVLVRLDLKRRVQVQNIVKIWMNANLTPQTIVVQMQNVITCMVLTNVNVRLDL